MKLKKLLDAARPDWFEFRNEGETAEIRIDGVIGGDWFDDGVTAEQFIRRFNALPQKVVDLHVNSPGGDVFEGLTIYNVLAASGKTIRGHVDGLAASIASVLLMACDTIEMPENSFLMIHDAWMLSIGNASQLRADAEQLDAISAQIAKIYADRSGREIDKIRDLMRGEEGADGSFLEASRCLELGLCDTVRENLKAAACVGMEALEGLPEPLRRMASAGRKRDLESALRDAGYSISEAKTIAAGKAFRRDGDGAGRNWGEIFKQLRGKNND